MMRPEDCGASASVVTSSVAEYRPSPDAFVPSTLYVYVVFDVSSESPYDVLPMPVAILAKSEQPAPVQRASLYVLAPPVGAVQLIVTVVDVRSAYVGVPGTLGSVRCVDVDE
jgi:hypothetical protein